MSTRKPKNHKKAPKLSTSWPTFDSLGQCSSAGIPLSVLKEAKRGGCPAFRSNRVYVGELLPWIFEQMGQSTDWVADAKRSEALMKRKKLAEMEGELVDRSAVEESAGKALAEMFGELDRSFVSEFPARVVGMNEVGIRTVAIECIEKLKVELRKNFEALQVEAAKGASDEKPV